jgi:aryl-alcohol dehydrogenase-like predicted oxidoreductase
VPAGACPVCTKPALTRCRRGACTDARLLLRARAREWSLFTRGCEKDLVPVCRELGIGFLAYRRARGAQASCLSAGQRSGGCDIVARP